MVVSGLSIGSRGNAAVNKSDSRATNGEQHGGVVGSENSCTLRVDAIVNAANDRSLGGGGLDGAIRAAVGPAPLAECKLLVGCETGQMKIAPGSDLPARFVIHTVGPRRGQS
jgi:O-acetyl-ADP-ribose deacetylase (regulator of RNase III)